VASARDILDGTPGETWTNDTLRVRYQFVASLVNTCGVCLQYHLKIGPPWPIPIHHGCRCRQVAIAPLKRAPEPFVDYRKLLEAMPRSQQAAAVGASNWKLLEAGVVQWEDVVTPARVRDLREVVSRKKLSVKAMVDAGVKPRYAEQAYRSVHTPQHELIEQKRRELIEQISKAGLAQEVLVQELAARLAARVVVAPGETYTAKAGVVLPGITGGTLPGVGPSHAEALAKALAAVTITRTPATKHREAKAQRRAAQGDVLYVRAPAGGAVSDVNGQFYKGGQLMPIHGLSAGEEKSPAKGEGPGSAPARPKEEGRGRPPREPRLGKTAAEIAQEQAEKHRWTEAKEGPLGEVYWLGENPHPIKKGPDPKKWREWVERTNGAQLGEVIKTAGDIYARNTIAAMSERERQGLTDPELRELLLENVGLRADSYDIVLTRKHIKAHPESNLGILMLASAVESKSPDLTADLLRISRAMK
jgi:hypothetical protein